MYHGDDNKTLVDYQDILASKTSELQQRRHETTLSIEFPYISPTKGSKVTAQKSPCVSTLIRKRPPTLGDDNETPSNHGQQQKQYACDQHSSSRALRISPIPLPSPACRYAEEKCTCIEFGFEQWVSFACNVGGTSFGAAHSHSHITSTAADI